jgi:hypothetical protein
MYPNAKGSEQFAVLDAVQPVSQGAGSATTGWISAANFHSFMALIKTGVLGASATVDAKIQQATTSGGAGAKDVTGAVLTQIVKATGDNKAAIINLLADQLDAQGGFCFIQLSVTVGTAASLIDATLFGVNPRFAPASDSNAAAVVQVVN